VGWRDAGESAGARPWITGSYHDQPTPEKFHATTAGCARATLHRSTRWAIMKISDRTKDLIKSGGEWISSVDLENAIMGHPAVQEAAVIAVPHPKWSERPLAVIVLRRGAARRRRHPRLSVEAVREVDGARCLRVRGCRSRAPRRGSF
jgi:fatty-acyl-CoA synthase